MNKKISITALLFLIGTLHTMVFSFIQFPGTFIDEDISQDPILYKGILYLFTVGVSCFHQPISRQFGLKNVLLLGLLGNIIGLLLLFIHHYLEHPVYHFSLYLSMAFFGAAMLSVVNSLVTYIIIEFPAKSVTAITAMFIFLNFGLMLTPIALNAAVSIGMTWSTFFVVMILLMFSMLAVKMLFFEPQYPKEYDHLRSGTLIWKEMHRRLALYVLAVFLYSLIESTFSLWGAQMLIARAPLNIAEYAISVFWIFMIIGQLLFMVPLYYLQPRKIFYFLMPMLIGALLYIPEQSQLSKISYGLAIGGMGCAVIYPIVLSLLEMEIIQASLVNRHVHYLPLIDTAVSFLMAAYLLGSAVVDIWTNIVPNAVPSHYFYLAIGLVIAITLLMYYLNKTRTVSSGIKGTFLRRD